MGRCEVRTRFWFGNPKGRAHSEDLVVNGKIMLKCIIGRQGGKVWIGFIWLRIGTGDELL
jgi:hypothetical protein